MSNIFYHFGPRDNNVCLIFYTIYINIRNNIRKYRNIKLQLEIIIKQNIELIPHTLIYMYIEILQMFNYTSARKNAKKLDLLNRILREVIPYTILSIVIFFHYIVPR